MMLEIYASNSSIPSRAPLIIDTPFTNRVREAEFYPLIGVESKVFLEEQVHLRPDRTVRDVNKAFFTNLH